MKRIVLHIGHAKTGTSSIQWYMRSNPRVLSKAGIIFPETLHGSRNHKCMIPLNPEAELPEKVDKEFSGDRQAAETAVAREWDETTGQCSISSAEMMVMSSEQMFRSDDVVIRSLFYRLRKISSDINVISYIRNPVSGYLSKVQQRLKRTHLISIPRTRPIRSVLEAYAQVNDGKIEPRPFDRAQMYGGDVVKDFLYKSISEELANKVQVGSVQRNTSMSPEAMVILQEFFRFCHLESRMAANKYHRRAKQVLMETDLLTEGFSKVKILPEIEDYVTRQAVDFLWLREEFGVEFGDLDYSLIGKPATMDIESIVNVDQVCNVDNDRVSAVRAAFLERLTDESFKRTKSKVATNKFKLKNLFRKKAAVANRSSDPAHKANK